MIENINYNQTYTASYTTSSQTTESDGNTNTTVTDTVSITGSSDLSATYSSSLNVDGEDAKYSRLRSLVANLLNQQGISTKLVLGDSSEVDIASISSDEANELISDDGYFGVEQTSERIFQFAVGIAGGDTSKYDEIVAGIEDGFQKAYEAFGDWLPDISYDTYEAVMNKLDNWMSESGAEVQA